MIYTDKIYSHIIKDLKKWPIFQFANNKNEYKKELVEIIFKDLVEKYGEDLKNEISKCAYLELKRIKHNPWKVDPPDAKKFWTELRKEVADTDKCANIEFCHFQLKRIISRYVEEIFGDFRIKTYRFARVFLTVFFNRIFNGLFVGSLFNLFGKRKSLKDKIKLVGYVEETRELFKKGVVILLPTHQSNLDSMIIGYTIDYKLGIPAFSYGAGLNLFNYEIPAFYMSKLGAYKVDRRKKNSIYFNTLLTYSKYSIQKNVNSIFFPGGTRSRSGEIETNLKTGLMGSLLEAQFEKVKDDKGKIFVVPVVLNYHSVLEAKSLIFSYLKSFGNKNYISRSKSMNARTKSGAVIKSIFKIFTKKSEFSLSFGKPMDVFGNNIDSNGVSYDLLGNKVEIRDYFKREGELIKDSQRDIVYTKMLAKKVAESYLNYNLILSSHLLAYSAYLCFKNKIGFENIFDLLKYDEKEEFIAIDQLKNKLSGILDYLREMEKDGKIFLSEELSLPIDELIKIGLDKIGAFHRENVLYCTKENELKTDNFGLLYYYSNRLSFLKLD